jgi:hypothetical protein
MINVNSDGTADIQNMQSWYSNVPVLAYNSPGRIKLKKLRAFDTGIYIDFGANATCRIAQLDSCAVNSRYVMIRTGDSSWVNACSSNVTGGFYESAYVEDSRDTLLFKNCYFASYTGRGIRNLSTAHSYIQNVKFHGNAPAIDQAGVAIFDSCRIDSTTKSYGIYESATTAATKSRKTIIGGYSTAGFYARNWADFGTTSSHGHNCFLDNTHVAIKFDSTSGASNSDTVWAKYNYFDTLYFSGNWASRIIRTNPDSICEPDHSMQKVALPQETKTSVPLRYSLGPAVPNPFNSTVEISFEMPVKCAVELSIFDIAGRQVKIIASGEFDVGAHRAIWNGKDDSGVEMPSGVYLYRLRADGFTDTKKMTLIR